jgi:hypothetical protein
VPFRHLLRYAIRMNRHERAQVGEIAGGQNRSPRENLVLGARLEVSYDGVGLDLSNANVDPSLQVHSLSWEIATREVGHVGG